MLKQSAFNGFCENIGKIFILSAITYSAVVLFTTTLKKDDKKDYQERLRKAYDGLSPEEYEKRDYK